MPRITDYTISQNMLYQMSKNTLALGKVYNELSTGQRLTQSSDDPSRVLQIYKQQRDLRNIAQYQDNLNRASQVSTFTYASVKSLKDIVTRASTLGISTDGLTDPTKYAANKAELNGLIEQALQLANTKQSGDYLFGGNKNDAAPFTAVRDTNGNITSVTYSGSASVASFEVNDGVTLSPYAAPADNQQLETTLTNLIALRDAFNAQSSSAVATATTAIATSENAIVGQMAAMGATQARIEQFQTQLKNNADATTADISANADTDITEASVRYSALQNAYQASLAAGSKILKVSLLDYL